MDIGEPERTYTVEPLEDPVPRLWDAKTPFTLLHRPDSRQNRGFDTPQGATGPDSRATTRSFAGDRRGYPTRWR